MCFRYSPGAILISSNYPGSIESSMVGALSNSGKRSLSSFFIKGANSGFLSIFTLTKSIGALDFPAKDAIGYTMSELGLKSYFNAALAVLAIIFD